MARRAKADSFGSLRSSHGFEWRLESDDRDTLSSNSTAIACCLCHYFQWVCLHLVSNRMGWLV